MNLQIGLNTPKNPYLKQPTPKILAKFSYLKKNPPIENFKPKNSLNHPRHLESGVPRPLPRIVSHH